MLYIMSYENPIIKDDKNNEYVNKRQLMNVIIFILKN